MNEIGSLFKKRPLITLTILYIVVLIFFDFWGITNKPPQNDISTALTSKESIFEGQVVSLPEKKRQKTVFIIHTTLLNGLKTTGNVLVSVPYTTLQEQNIEPGDLLTIRGRLMKPYPLTNPGGFDYATYLSRKRIYTLAFANTIRKTGKQSLPFYESAAYQIRMSFLRTIERHLPGIEGLILAKMIVGTKDYLPDEERIKFIDSGVMHVLVVSGLHVSFCIALFWGFFRALGFGYRKAAFLTIPFIPVYALVTGANPPVVRASIMAVFIIISLSLARESNVFQSLSLAALLILLFNPQALFTASFQLSFAATIGIIYLYPFLIAPIRSKQPLIRWFASLVAVSLAAQLGVNPLIAYYFNRLSLSGLFANIIVVPMVGIIITAGLALYFASLVFSSTTLVIACIVHVNHFLLSFLMHVVGFFSSLPGAVITVPTPSVLFCITYYVILIGIFKVKKLHALLYVFIGILSLYVITTYRNQIQQRNQVEVTFLDVGYGDAVHIRFPNGENWLVDGGGSYNPGFSIGNRVLLPYFSGKNIKTLNVVVLTNPVFHRYGGLAAVVKNVTVQRCIGNPEISLDQNFIAFMELLGEKGIPFEEVWAGETYGIGMTTVTILSPRIRDSYKNNNSLVLKLEYLGKRVLLTSDIGQEAQSHLLTSGYDLRTDVLQLPRQGHGPILKAFQERTTPEYIIVSEGKKSYYAVAQWNKQKIFSTMKNGAITILMRKEGIIAKGFKK